MSFSLKVLEGPPRECLYGPLQRDKSRFYNEGLRHNLVIGRAEFMAFCSDNDIPHPHSNKLIHKTSNSRHQCQLDRFFGLNQNKLKTSTKLKPPQLNPF